MAISKTNSPARAGMKRPRTVRFNNTVKHVLDTRRVEPQQIKATWYSKVELTHLKADLKGDLTMLFTGQVKSEETNTASWRGLEAYTQRNTKFQKYRKERRTFLVAGVKDLQQRLRAEGLATEHSISKLVTIASKQAVQEAQNLAALDTLAANQIYLETFLAPKVEMPAVGVPQEALLPHQQLVTARTA
ncbi:expressed unknown protein [Seminavis robusta]|uniref:Uncharacterized protein n=1 Tax=Seminavis robusta TaxID=568900 RepID=A0A9N8HB62_9STRA|nr:expressed unknown protein [Seminavis robusta]|eukprot:Sro171_g075810.1 n/a (189) ;mRNA; f:68921-69487